MESATVAGVDGCRGGWLVVTRSLRCPGDAAALLVSSFAEVLDITRAAVAVAVDMPIGLPERSGPGGRKCDIAARTNLGPRQSAVFAVPARSAVLEHDYPAACTAAALASDPPRKVSKQTFNLFPKMREVDAAMTAELQQRVVECHPEVAFWAMNGESALLVAKKVKSRPNPPGLALRRDLLRAAGYPGGLLEGGPWPAAAAGRDDLLDAAACSWSAARIALGLARRFPADPPCDGRGLRMEIWA